MGFGAADPAVTIRTPTYLWVALTAAGAVIVLEGLRALSLPQMRIFLILPSAWVFVALGSVVVAEAFWLRTRGIDLLPTHALVKGFRRRVIPWQDVRAVVPSRRLGSCIVQLHLDTGEPVTLRAPVLSFGLRGRRQRAAFERDYHRIGQWWLEHRGR